MNIHLAPRELQCCELALQGLQDKEIARTTGLSPGTVRVYLKHARCKTQTRNRMELITCLLKEGIISLCILLTFMGQVDEFNRPASRGRQQRITKRARNNVGRQQLALIDELTGGFAGEYLQSYDV
jgi:DNA-binding CsgD family transcriptional regulator